MGGRIPTSASSTSLPEWCLQPASSAYLSPGWEVPAAPSTAWWSTALVLCFDLCCPEMKTSAEGAGRETLPESYVAHRTPGQFCRRKEVASLCQTQAFLPELCAAPNTSEVPWAPDQRGSMDTVEPGTQTGQTKWKIFVFSFIIMFKFRIYILHKWETFMTYDSKITGQKNIYTYSYKAFVMMDKF